MKIVYCIGALFQAGGTERVLVNKANYFADILGYEVHILVANQQDKPFCFEISSKVSVHDMNVVQYLRTKKVVKGLSFFQMVLSLRKIYQQKIDSIQPDVISVLELGYDDFLIPALKTNALKIREIHSSHAAQKKIKLRSGKFSKSFLILKLQQYYINKYDAVVLLTQEDSKARTYFKNKYVIPNAIDFGLGGAALDSKKAISIGRLDEFKNFKDQLIIWKNVVQQHPDWTLHIYGEGIERIALEKQILDLNLQNHVFLEGTTQQVKEKLKQSSLFLFTSLAEGFGMVVVEAMQLGLTVVSYQCPCGPAEIITNGSDGFLVPMQDLSVFENHVLNLIKDHSLRERISQAAIESSQRFTTANIIPQWVILYQQLLALK